MSDFHDIELSTLRLAVETLKSERQEIIAAKQKDAKMALRLYDQNRQLKAEVVHLRKALEKASKKPSAENLAKKHGIKNYTTNAINDSHLLGGGNHLGDKGGNKPMERLRFKDWPEKHDDICTLLLWLIDEVREVQFYKDPNNEAWEALCRLEDALVVHENKDSHNKND